MNLNVGCLDTSDLDLDRIFAGLPSSLMESCAWGDDMLPRLGHSLVKPECARSKQSIKVEREWQERREFDRNLKSVTYSPSRDSIDYLGTH